MGRKTVVLLVLTFLIVSIVPMIAIPVTAEDTKTIEEGEMYPAGIQLRATGADSGATVGLYATADDQLIQNLTADANGVVTFDTDDLTRGRYHLAQNDSELVRFRMYRQSIRIADEELIAKNGGRTIAEVEIDVNKGDQQLIVDSEIPNLASRTDNVHAEDGTYMTTTDGSGSAVLRIDVSDLSHGGYTLSTQYPSSGVTESTEIFVKDVEPEPQSKTVTAKDGGIYWTSWTLDIQTRQIVMSKL